jgi:hypothetical protein
VLIFANAMFKCPDAQPLQSEANMQSLVAHLRLQPKHLLSILVELSPRIIGSEPWLLCGHHPNFLASIHPLPVIPQLQHGYHRISLDLSSLLVQESFQSVYFCAWNCPILQCFPSPCQPLFSQLTLTHYSCGSFAASSTLYNLYLFLYIA